MANFISTVSGKNSAVITAVLMTALAAFLPTFSRPYIVMEGWVDQSYVAGLFGFVLDGKASQALNANWAGPGWLGLGTF